MTKDEIFFETCGSVSYATVDGIRFKFDTEDLWVFDKFTCFTVPNKRYLRCSLWVQTEFGPARLDILFHKLIMKVHGLNDKDELDHINRDKCDNRKTNLRRCNRGLNVMNRTKSPYKNVSSPYKGVASTTRHKSKPWRAYLSGQHLGYFADPVEAAKAYDRAAHKRYGAFAFLNFGSK